MLSQAKIKQIVCAKAVQEVVEVAERIKLDGLEWFIQHIRDDIVQQEEHDRQCTQAVHDYSVALKVFKQEIDRIHTTFRKVREGEME